MGKYILSREPQEINENVWYYEDGRGIEIINKHDCNGHEEYSHIKIPWRKLAASVGRHFRQKQENKKAKAK